VQWNDDIVDRLPEDAELLAETAAGEVQVVRFAQSVWGVQLHPEADDRVLAPWAAEDARRYDDDRIERGLAEVTAARAEMERAWRPLAESLVRLARIPR
jgi:GMP synthase (glutamine-hydrolysing)